MLVNHVILHMHLQYLHMWSLVSASAIKVIAHWVLSFRHPFLSKWQTNVLEEVCKGDWHNVRSYVFFYVIMFQTKISDSVCNDLNSANTESWEIPTMAGKELIELMCKAELAISCGSSLLVGDLSNKDVELSWMQQATARSAVTCSDIEAEMTFCHRIR